jgi:hypothetical protein
MQEFGPAIKAGELEVPKPTTPVGTSGLMDLRSHWGVPIASPYRLSGVELRFRRRI